MKKLIQKDKPERHVKAEKKPPPKEEKKVKSTKVEIKVKKEVKDGKGEAKTTEKVKQAETKTTEVGLIKAKPKVKEEKALQTVTKSEKKDQYAFCRYVIDMFAQGDFYPGHKELVPPPLLLEHSPRKKPLAIEERREEKKKTDAKKAMTETKKKEKEGKKEKAHEKTAAPKIKKADKKEAAVSKELKKPAKTPAAKPATKKAAAPDLFCGLSQRSPPNKGTITCINRVDWEFVKDQCKPGTSSDASTTKGLAGWKCS
ncbi:triadin-like [Athene cunicularia]|uniref:triadin-like n=1 Tax=Athene cunicularia TaxID=194338 RepID=UPI000EF75784|nr:triadin-like [Athene cunicularia]